MAQNDICKQKSTILPKSKMAAMLMKKQGKIWENTKKCRENALDR